jgi:pimeloyl-ACP methyl ester carboxylesterase
LTGQFRYCLYMVVSLTSLFFFRVLFLSSIVLFFQELGTRNGPSPDSKSGPGSFLEVRKILPLLTQSDAASKCDNTPSFHIIAPSLPNFGFSQGVSKRGFALAQYAETCHKLMLQLGYPQYVTQAGDWGFWITRSIGKLYPEACRASHLNMIYASPPSWVQHPILKLMSLMLPYSEHEKKGQERREWLQKESRGEV